MKYDVNTVNLATELTAARSVNCNNRTNADDVPAFLISMHAAVSQLSGGSAPFTAESLRKPMNRP